MNDTKQDSFQVPTIEPIELDRRLKEGEAIRLLDVREPFEAQIADLPPNGQLRIPLGEVADRVGELDRSTRIVVYCRSGKRSARVVRHLREAGFPEVYNLEGGVLRWRRDVDPSLNEY